MIKVINDCIQNLPDINLLIIFYPFIISPPYQKLGIDGTDDEIKLRKQVFGSNKLIAITSKSFLSLVLEALQEKTMIMLEICAFVSLALSFYHPTNESSSDDHRSKASVCFLLITNTLHTHT